MTRLIVKSRVMLCVVVTVRGYWVLITLTPLAETRLKSDVVAVVGEGMFNVSLY